MSRRLLAALLGALLLPLAAAAGQASRPLQGADSVAAAFAVAMAPRVLAQTPGSAEIVADADSVASFVAGMAQAFAAVEPRTARDKGLRAALAMVDNVMGMRQMQFPLAFEGLLGAFPAALRGEAPAGFATPEEADAYLRSLMAASRPLERADSTADQALLRQVRELPGVTELPSGLLLEVLTEGEGAPPAQADTAVVRYTGRLSSGKVFDSATDRPVELPLARLIPGFSQGLQMMRPGGSYRLVIPPDLGYGQRQAGTIPPGSVLDFTIDLVDVKRAPAQNQNNH